MKAYARRTLVEWYSKNRPKTPIDLGDVFIVWSCKTLQNYKCLVSTTVSGDGIYAEYTFGMETSRELYERMFIRNSTNTCHTEE